MSSTDLNVFLSLHKPNFELIRDGLKVRCLPTNQDFPTTVKGVEELNKYVLSKRYLKAVGEKKGIAADAKKVDWDAKYGPHIIQHKKVKNGLFCQLTGAELNKIESEVEKHVNGKRFKRARTEFEELVAKGSESLDEEEEEEEEGGDSDDEDEDSLSGVDEIDFTPEPKRTRVVEVEGKSKKGEEERKTVTSEESKSTKKAEVSEKSESKKDSKSKASKKEKLLVDSDASEEEEETSIPMGKLNKKAKKRLAAQETDSKPDTVKVAKSDSATATETTATKKSHSELSQKQLRGKNSKKRKILKAKEEQEIEKEAEAKVKSLKSQTVTQSGGSTASKFKKAVSKA